MKILALVVVGLLTLAGVAQASILEDIVKFVSDHPMKTGVYYDAIDQEGKGLIGTVVKEDFLYKNVDLDLAIAAANENMFNIDINNYQTVLGGASYNIPIGTKYALSIGANAGFDRVENFKDIGEFKWGGNIALKW